MMEMVSRVRAVLRRSAPKAETSILTIGEIRLDPSGHNVTAAGNPVSLTLKEFEMLRILMENPGQVLTARQTSGRNMGL